MQISSLCQGSCLSHLCCLAAHRSGHCNSLRKYKVSLRSGSVLPRQVSYIHSIIQAICVVPQVYVIKYLHANGPVCVNYLLQLQGSCTQIFAFRDGVCLILLLIHQISCNEMSACNGLMCGTLHRPSDENSLLAGVVLDEMLPQQLNHHGMGISGLLSIGQVQSLQMLPRLASDTQRWYVAVAKKPFSYVWPQQLCLGPRKLRCLIAYCQTASMSTGLGHPCKF